MHFRDELQIDVSHIKNEKWGITEQDIENHKKEIQKAAMAVAKIRKTGVGPDGTAVLFPHLPYILEEQVLITEDEKEALKKLPELAKGQDIVVSIGIGGSYLGNQALFDMFCGPYWNLLTKEERKGYPRIYFAGQNVDPLSLSQLVEEIHRQGGRVWWKQKVLLLVISKSGTTLEPIMAARYLRSQLAASCHVQMLTITDASKGRLRPMAEENHWPCFTVPDGIGGRFSIFSQVGLVFAQMAGIPIEEFLAGAKMTEEACRSEEIHENAALHLAALKYIAKVEKGIDAEIIMPYGNDLRSLGWWYAQLLGESLGKKYTTDGKEIHYGRVPVTAVGTTDMHSLTQEHQEGKKNKLVQFITVAETDEPVNVLCDEKEQSGMVPMHFMMQTAMHANEGALAQDGRMSCSVAIHRLTPFHIGALMYFFFLTVAYEGAMADINPFDQPGVEKYKKILHETLYAYIQR